MEKKIYKLKEIFILLVLMAFNYSLLYSQDDKVVNDIERKKLENNGQHKKLSEVIWELKKLYTVDVLFEDKIINGLFVPLDIINYKESLDANFKRILEPLSLTYKKLKEAKYIIYKVKVSHKETHSQAHINTAGFNVNALLNSDVASNILFLENKTSANELKLEVKGVVQDENGNGLGGVTVLEKGTKNAVTSVESGSFRILIQDSSAVLEFSYTGYFNKEIAVGGRTYLELKLQPQLKEIEDVVVVGYGSQRRKDVTGAIASVSGATLNLVPLTNVDQKLQGQIAGVQVSQTSGSPGGGSTIRIRGAGTIGNNQPLFVIDGFPIGNVFDNEVNPLNTISPDDIENIEVLKDASATAIYGSRGANGVLLITTKKGKTGKPRIDLTMSSGFQEVVRKIPMLSGPEFADFYRETRIKGWNDRVDTRPAGQTPDQYFATPNNLRGNFRIFDYFLDTANSRINTDWQDQIFRKSPMSNLQLTLTGGSDRMRYMFSGGYLNQEGIVMNSGLKRYTFRLNLDTDVSKKFKVGINMAPTYADIDYVNTQGHFNQGSPITAALVMSPSLSVYNPDRTYSQQLNRTDMNLAAVGNPIALIEEATRKRSNARLLANTFAEYTIIKGLRIRSSVGINYLNERSRDFFSSKWARGAAPAAPASAQTIAQENISWLNENTLTYNRLIKKHKVDAVVGYTMQEARGERITNGRSSLPNDLLPYVISPADQGNTSQYEWGLISWLGRVNYNYDGRYLITGTARRDGSSRFGANNRWGTFPSAAIGWVVSEESFMKSKKLFSQIKLRTSYGKTGNFEIGNYESYSLIAPGQYAGGVGLGNNVNIFNVSTIANPDLTWETAYKWDIGLDIGILSGRLTFTADFYKNTTEGMLLSVQIPSSSGFITSLQNIGKIENKGWEVSISSENIITKKFTWKSNLNISHNENKVLDLGAFGTKIYASSGSLVAQLAVTEVGSPLGQFFGRIREGVFLSDAEAAAYVDKNGNRIQPFAKGGDVKWRDINNDGIINDNDRTKIGSPLPNYIFGFTNNFAFAGFDLSILINGSKGNHLANLPLRWMTNSSGTLNQHALVKNRWKSEQDPGDGKTPRFIQNARNGGVEVFSDYFVEDASFLRIRNVSLGYTIPKKIFKRSPVTMGRLYASVANLYTFTNYRGYDPETNERGNESISQGIDLGGYPIARTWQFGLNFSF